MQEPPIRDASTIIVLRRQTSEPSVLMGQRGATAAFLPGKFVFPGGAVDANDAQVRFHAPLPQAAQDLLAQDSARPATALAAAAIRELWEETGQILGHPGTWHGAPQGWRGYAATGHLPRADTLQFLFRAVTPPGRPRRFDARFFMVDAGDLTTDPDDFTGAEDELSHLQWIPLSQVRRFDLPFITKVVLAEIMETLRRGTPPASVPFFRNDDEAHLVARLRGADPLGRD